VHQREVTTLPNGRTSDSLIAVSDVDRIFSRLQIKKLADTLKLPALGDDPQFAESIRNDVRLFIEAKGRLNNAGLQEAIRKLYQLTARAKRDDLAAGALARAIDEMPPDLRNWLDSFNPEIPVLQGDDEKTSKRRRTRSHLAEGQARVPTLQGDDEKTSKRRRTRSHLAEGQARVPTGAEIVSPETRASAVQQLRDILSYGGSKKRGRKRPTGRHSQSFAPRLRVPKIEPNRPRGDAEREFVLNLALTYLKATGKMPPYENRGPFSRFVHECFELVGAPRGSVTRLINELGQARRAAANHKIEREEDARLSPGTGRMVSARERCEE
jgi:hypothetical protein